MGGNSPSSSRRKHCCGGLAVATDISWNFSESEMTVQKIMNALHDCPSDSTEITGLPISSVGNLPPVDFVPTIMVTGGPLL